MALVLGTNCGLVTETPSAGSQTASSPESLYQNQRALRILPEQDITVTELGFMNTDWIDADYFNIGIYSGNSKPDSLIVQFTGNKLSDFCPASAFQSWCKYTGISVNLTANTPYWLAIATDASDNGVQAEASGGNASIGFPVVAQTKTLEDTWSSGTVSQESTKLLAIYAKYEASSSGSVGFSGLLNSKLLGGNLIK